MVDISKLEQDGYLEIPFEESSSLSEMQNLIRDHLGCEPPEWHRDTFYGNTPWEGPHREPSQNARECADSDKYHNLVKKGSIANQVGYVYAAKSDNTIANMGQSKVVFITPQVGTAVFFFGCMAHMALNRSESTRVSVDLRLNLHAPTETKNGCYQPLCRGVAETCIEEFFER